MADFDPNYYRLLHVHPDAPTEIIRASYRALMKSLRLHPDLGGDTQHAARLNVAVEVLCTPDKRRAYDQQLAARSPAPRPQHPQPAATTPAQDSNACAFCGQPQPVHALGQPSAVCRHCASPICPTVRPPRVSRSRRALERMPRRIAVNISLAGSGLSFLTATEDISINGASFTSATDMPAGQVVRLESSLWAAVCIVRHAQIDTRGSRARWRVGVEFLTLLIKTPDVSFSG